MTAFKLCCTSRAIDFQALIGNVGGYIGLVLGYSIVQIPDLILFLFWKLRKYYLQHKQRNYINPTSNPSCSILVKETQMGKVAESNTKIQENDIYKILHSLKMDLDKTNQKIDSTNQKVDRLSEVILEKKRSTI